MIPFKIDPGTVYTDTDSIFTTSKMDPSLIGPELGKMKDELAGKVISEAYFLGVKQYAYKVLDGTTKSVWAGVKRDSLSFEDIRKVFSGLILTIQIPVRFFKSIVNLNISIKPTSLSIRFRPGKRLVDNHYIPVNLSSTTSSKETKEVKIIQRYVNLVKKFISNIFLY